MDLVRLTLVTVSRQSHLSRVSETTTVPCSSRSSHEWILSVNTSEGHALPQHFLATSIWTKYAVAVFSKLGVDDWRILATII